MTRKIINPPNYTVSVCYFPLKEREEKRRGTENDDEADVVDGVVGRVVDDIIDLRSSAQWLRPVSDFARPLVRKRQLLDRGGALVPTDSRSLLSLRTSLWTIHFELRESMSQFVYKNLIRSLDLQDHRRFQQRYYEFFDYFRLPDGPIFLKICGESSCNGIANDYISVSL